jgi:fructoselysine-6-P-deglycase FrlB-like protein
VDAVAFLADLERKPDALAGLASRLRADDPWAPTPAVTAPALLLVGMGSSAYAAGLAATRLRALGHRAVAELASSDLLPHADALPEGTVVVAVSAGGGSAETLAAAERYRGRVPLVVLTEAGDSPLARLADHVVLLGAGPEAGGVACRSYQHTLALLLALESGRTRSGLDVAAAVAGAAAATTDLLARRDTWLPRAVELLDGPDGTHVVAPVGRSANAAQAALMLREGPRRPAYAHETGDWSHVDVYLTRTTDYRLLLHAGSPWDAPLLGWTTARGSTVLALGADVDAAAWSLRYRGDDEPSVALLTEVLVAELVAATLWARASVDGP